MNTSLKPQSIVVLDTTETAKNCHLRGTDFLLFDWFLNHEASSELVLSRMFIDETKNHFRKTHEKAIRDFEKAIASLNKASGKTVVRSDFLPDTGAACEEYNEIFEGKLKSWKAEIIEYDLISTARLAARGLNANKPFNGEEGKKGLRDAIIWESVLHLAKTTHADTKIILVSKNKNDFCGSSGTDLHEHLAKDLSDLDISPSKIQIVLGLDAFCKAFVIDKIPEETGLQFRLESGEFKHFTIPKLLEQVGTELYSEIENAASRLPPPPRSELWKIDLNHVPDKTEYESVLKVDDSIALSLVFQFSGEVEFIEYFTDYEHDEIYEGSAGKHDGIWIANLECVLKGPEYELAEASVKNVTATSTPQEVDEE